MSTVVKFQQDTVEAVLRAFSNKQGSRRFLVADEVGLGKTIVAQNVIKRMAESKKGALNVVYISSNLAIAKQNAEKLVGFLPEKERKSSIAKVDRLSLLLTMDPLRSRKVRLFTMTPGTSVPSLKRRISTGTIRERSLIMQVLYLINSFKRSKNFEYLRSLKKLKRVAPAYVKDAIASAWPGGLRDNWFSRYDSNPLRGRVSLRTFDYIHRETTFSLGRNLPWKGVVGFLEGLRDVFGYRALSDVGEALVDDQISLNPESITKMRTSLALAGLRMINPDLIIFDEFQRFKDLLYTQSDTQLPAGTAPLVNALRGELSQNTSLLLLSATPYRMYESRVEEKDGGGHYEDFYRLVEFLYGGSKAQHARRTREHLQRLFETRASYLRQRINDGGDVRNKEAIESVLRRVMCRTERATSTNSQTNVTKSICGTIEPDDARMFGLFNESVNPDKRIGLPAFWDSIPYPLQTMGTGYVATKQLRIPSRVPSHQKFKKPVLVAGKRRQKVTHPKLRSIMESPTSVSQHGLADPRRLVKPWLAPSLPWWRLSGAWADQALHPEKLLIFSRFRAVPNAVSGLLSFHTEREALKHHNDLKTEKVSSYRPMSDWDSDLFNGDIPEKYNEKWGSQKRSRQWEDLYRMGGLFARSTALGVLALDPTTHLTSGTDGLRPSYRTIRRKLKQTLTSFFEMCNVVIRDEEGTKKNAENSRKKFSLACRIRVFDYRFAHKFISKQKGPFARGHKLYEQTELKNKTLECDFADEDDIPIVFTPADLDVLVDLLVGGIGNIIARSLLRVCYGTQDLATAHSQRYAEHWQRMSEVSIEIVKGMLGFAYVNRSLTGVRKKKSWQRLIQLCIDGNLESVIDEHFWIVAKLKGLDGGSEMLINALCTHLEELFDVRDGSTQFRECTVARNKMPVRTNVARSYTDFEADRGPSKGKAMRSRTKYGQQTKTAKERLMARFNSPFWPHVLTTTSVGQEGLDFHYWCNSLVHWDVRTNPIDMEQREGRIQRFGGLGVRQEIAKLCGERMWSEFIPAKSPWKQLEEIVSKEDGGSTSDMQPWWQYGTSKPDTYRFDLPFTQQNQRFERVQKLQSLYRLALGQTNQEALVDELSSNDEMTPERIRELMVDLRPNSG